MKKFNKKGFTLIELLIVVVIIAIMAALILPKMLAQPERAITAEAMQYLGVIGRSFEAASGGGSTIVTAASSGDPIAPSASDPDGTASTPNGEWSSLGLDALPANSHFSYTCTAPVVGPPAVAARCTAKRLGAATTPKGTGTMTMDMETRRIVACDGVKYKPANLGTDKATCV